MGGAVNQNHPVITPRKKFRIILFFILLFSTAIVFAAFGAAGFALLNQGNDGAITADMTGDSCEFKRETHKDGDVFFSEDEDNQCICNDGVIYCTLQELVSEVDTDVIILVNPIDWQGFNPNKSTNAVYKYANNGSLHVISNNANYFFSFPKTWTNNNGSFFDESGNNVAELNPSGLIKLQQKQTCFNNASTEDFVDPTTGNQIQFISRGTIEISGKQIEELVQKEITDGNAASYQYRYCVKKDDKALEMVFYQGDTANMGRPTFTTVMSTVMIKKDTKPSFVADLTFFLCNENGKAANWTVSLDNNQILTATSPDNSKSYFAGTNC